MAPPVQDANGGQVAIPVGEDISTMGEAPPEVHVAFSGVSCWVPRSVGPQKTLSLGAFKRMTLKGSAAADQAKDDMRQVGNRALGPRREGRMRHGGSVAAGPRCCPASWAGLECMVTASHSS